MATNNISYTIRVDKEIKEQCDRIYAGLGMTLSGAIKIFMHKSVQTGGLPFDVTGSKADADKYEKADSEGFSF